MVHAGGRGGKGGIIERGLFTAETRRRGEELLATDAER
jgi:hypothetical protein